MHRHLNVKKGWTYKCKIQVHIFKYVYLPFFKHCCTMNTHKMHFMYLQAEKDHSERDTSVARVRITILDENDNPPKFEHSNYYSGM